METFYSIYFFLEVIGNEECDKLLRTTTSTDKFYSAQNYKRNFPNISNEIIYHSIF